MSVHLLVLIHGMWGNPNHLAELNRHIIEAHAARSHDVHLEVLLAETNSDNSTYDGIDWGGERVSQEVIDKVGELRKEGKPVRRFSVTGYSLGGLIARYLVGILYQKGFFEDIAPVNFNTIATPHLGLPRYLSFMSSVTSSLGPRLLSRTGEQFYLVDKWSATGRPLIEVMADPQRIFLQALKRFENIRIYANAVRDLTVPYVTAAIETEDPFALSETMGIEVQYDAEHFPLIKSFSTPSTPLVKPVVLSLAWFRNRKPTRPILPPALQFRFPFNLLIYSLLPVLIPVTLSLVLVHFSLASRKSRARIRLLEEGSGLKGQNLASILTELEEQVEHTVANLVDDTLINSESAASMTNLQGATLGHIPKPSQSTKTISTEEGHSNASSTSNVPMKKDVHQSKELPVLTPVQVKVAGWLNQLPLHKELAYFPDVRNAHAIIVCRDIKRFEAHRRGEGVARHWAKSFVL